MVVWIAIKIKSSVPWVMSTFPYNFIIFCKQTDKLANLISKLNFYKLIPYPMDNCFTGRRDRSRQTPEKDVLYIIPAGPVSSVHSLGGASYLLPV